MDLHVTSPPSGSQSLSTPDQVSAFLKVVQNHGVKELDTARVYNAGKCEELLGEVSASKTFAISTKAPAFSPGSLVPEKILENCNKSLKALNVGQVDISYLHGPDRSTPLEEQCSAINQLYEEGRFQRFGVCNLRDDEVAETHEICKREGWVRPSVYQGSFSPLNRKAAETLFPLLRILNMSFYAFWTRYDAMPHFAKLFLNETIVAELKRLTKVCEARGFSVLEATLRWFKHHSELEEGDGFILRASRVEQIEKSLEACEKEPLPGDIAEEFESMWNAIKDKAPGYC
ncbi:NADP-dependent oxidoreductase domain-containing protein [Delphinella strobiligena]|nr:NADP-dependent oxidoreductase domain-containing protein [Delphinella strobiligena]